MRGRTLWLAGLVAAGLTLAPAAARAQDGGLIPDALTVRAQTPEGELPDYEVPLPLGHPPANKGGLFIASEFLFWRQTNILEQWPEDWPRPSKSAVCDWLKRAVNLGLVLRRGTGKRGSQYLYWLPEQEAKWRADPNYDEELESKLEQLR